MNEKDFRKKIASLTANDWKPLIDLIAKIEKKQEFGKLVFPGRDENGDQHIPYWSSGEIVSEFERIVYDIPVVFSFDWPSWKKGRMMLDDIAFDFDTIDMVSKCKLITMIVRRDHFSEGVLISAFESGLILKILKSMQKVLNRKFGEPL